ncbi:MAG: pilus assembly protein PilM, partial [Dictyoglomus sp.]
VQNSVEVTVPELPQEYTIVSIGAETITIHAVRKGMPLFTRDVWMGGNQLTRAIMANFDLDFWEAEEVKLGNRQVHPGKEPLLKRLFIEYVGEWVKEIGKAVEYIRSSFSDLSISNLYLTGGGSLLPGIKDAISMETRLNVIYVDPFAGLIVDPKKFDEEYLKEYATISAQVVGLALREAKDK